MKLHCLPLIIAVAHFVLPHANLTAQTVATDPVGFVKLTIAAGNPRTTALSVPLLDTANISGQAVGQITGVSSNTITNSNAGWATNGLSAATNPHLIQITSGFAAGRMFLIATNPNTATSVTINSTDLLQGNLTTLGVAVNDTYKIVPCDTLNTLFGTNPTAAPPTGLGVRGGTSPTNSDNVVLVVNGTSRTYFYRTNNTPGWVSTALGNPLSSNTPIPPYVGLQYIRRATSNISFTATGSVPTSLRRLSVKNSGQTLIAQYWPANSSLGGTNMPGNRGGLDFQTIPGWVSSTNAKNADKVIVSTNTTNNPLTYYYDGTNWRSTALGNPIRNTNITVGIGAGIQIMKIGSNAGYSTYSNSMPYSLQ